MRFVLALVLASLPTLVLPQALPTQSQTAPANDNSMALLNSAPVAAVLAGKASATFIQPLTGAVPISRDAKAAQIIDIADFGVACDAADQRAKMQAAIDAIPAGAVLRNSCVGLVAVGANPSGSYGLKFSRPIRLECTSGGGYMPLPSLGNTISFLYFYGSAYYYLPTSMDGCFIGNYSGGSRFGLHAVVLDTQQVGAEFFQPSIRNSYIQGNKDEPNGFGIFLINNPANFVGGIHNTTLCENSTIFGGYSLNNVGDSIIIRNCINIGPGMIYVNLIHNPPDAGGSAGNFVIDGGPLTNTGGIVIDCAISAQIVNFVAEQVTTTVNANASLIDLKGSQCQLQNVTIANGQAQANSGTALSSLVRVGNAANTVIDNMRLATSTAFPPVVFTAQAVNSLYGAGNVIASGGGTVSDLGTGTRRAISVPFSVGQVAIGGADSCGTGFRCLRVPN